MMHKSEASAPAPASADIAVIILALNEEKSIPYALQSVAGWAREIYVVDSLSGDNTTSIARDLGASVVVHPFESFSDQRNWALDNLPITSAWVLFLDSDEVVPPVTRDHMAQAVNTATLDICAFFTPIQMVFLGRRLKHGDLYRSLIRLFRKDCGHYVATGSFREKLIVEGRVQQLQYGLLHDDKKSVGEWITDQLPRIAADAREQLRREGDPDSALPVSSKATMEGGRSAWLRRSVLLSLPGPLRPFLQFTYRYLLHLGFLDGWRGFIFHFLLQFWYPVMVEAEVIELRQKQLATRSLPKDPPGETNQ